MKILWVCNFMLPAIAEKLGVKATNKEGWLVGLSDKIMNSEESKDVELSVCFPVMPDRELIQGEVLLGQCGKKITYYAYPEDNIHLEEYQEATENRMLDILKQDKPDVIHIFGTEYPHALAMAKAAKNLGLEEKILVGIQGYMTEYAKCYYADVPERVVQRTTFRDWLKKDSIVEQKEKFDKRAVMERELLQNIIHITGRTDFDYQTINIRNAYITQTGNQQKPAQYHFMNETLRSNFYNDVWDKEKCNAYTIFCSQGNYPIKGIHKALQAVGELKDKYPQIRLIVAGDRITANQTIKDKIKISSYGKYLLELVKKYGLEENVLFVGSLNAEEMKRQYMDSFVFLSCSVIENSPNSVGEAMLLGMPVISSDVGGVRNLMSEKEGYIYDFKDVEALKNIIVDIFEHREVAAKKGQLARKRAIQTHDGETNYLRLLEIYNEIGK